MMVGVKGEFAQHQTKGKQTDSRDSAKTVRQYQIGVVGDSEESEGSMRHTSIA